MKRMRNLILLGMWLSIPSVSHALEVFGNGSLASSANTGGNTFNANNAWAIPFTPGASSLDQRTLTGAWVLTGGETVAITFSVAIYDDAGTLAGPSGTALASGSLGLNANDPIAWRFVTFSTPVVLTASDNYYVSVEEPTASTNFVWAKPSTNPSYSNLSSGSSYQITGGSELAANVWRRSGVTWNDSLNTVTADNFGVQLVPEPSTYVLSGIGVMTLAFIHRKKRA